MEENANLTPMQLLEQSVNRFKTFTEEAKAKQLQEYKANQEATKMNTYSMWLNASTQWVTDDCNQITRLRQVADWLNTKFYWGTKVIKDDELVSFVQKYLDANQDNDYWKMTYDYIADNSNTSCDPTDYYQNMWYFNKPAEQTIKKIPEEQANGDVNRVWPFANDEWTVVWDLLGSIPWTIENVWWLISSWIDSWLNKVWLLSDEAVEKWEKVREMYKTSDFVPWINEEDFTYKTAEFLDEIAAVTAMEYLTAWAAPAWETWVATKAPWLIKMLNYIYKNKRGKIALDTIKRWLWGGKDMFFLNTLEWEETDLSDMWRWALANILLGRMFSKSKADKKTTKWIMGSTEAKEVMTMLSEKWVKTLESIWEFINKRFSWTKQQIIEQSRKWAESAEKLLDWLLSISSDRFDSETATKILTAIAENIESKISSAWNTVTDSINKEAAARIRKLISSDSKYTLTELKNTIRELADSEINPFTEKFWKLEETNKEVKEQLWERYREIKKFIEDKWKELWLWDIENLNREIYTSNEIAKGTFNKEVREWISDKMDDFLSQWTKWWILWAIWWFLTWNTTKWAVIWAFTNYLKSMRKKLSKSTEFKTKMANLTYFVNWESKAHLTDWISNRWKDEMAYFLDDELVKILENADKKWWEDMLRYLTKSWAEIWAMELTEELTD